MCLQSAYFLSAFRDLLVQSRVHGSAHSCFAEPVQDQTDAPIAGRLLPVLHVLHFVRHKLVDLVEVCDTVEERLVEHAFRHHILRAWFIDFAKKLFYLLLLFVANLLATHIGFKEDGLSV